VKYNEVQKPEHFNWHSGELWNWGFNSQLVTEAIPFFRTYRPDLGAHLAPCSM